MNPYEPNKLNQSQNNEVKERNATEFDYGYLLAFVVFATLGAVVGYLTPIKGVTGYMPRAGVFGIAGSFLGPLIYHVVAKVVRRI